MVGLSHRKTPTRWRALVEIIESPDERARRAQNAHQRVCDSFTVQPQVAKIEAILQQVAQSRP